MESGAPGRVCFALTPKSERLTLPPVENKRKNILLVVVSLLAILIIGLFFALWNPAPPPAVKMPVPNGYATFVQAASQVQKQTTEFSKMDPASLFYLVQANSNALAVARSGLAEKSRVPLEFSQQYMSTHLTELAQMKLIAYAFLAEGRQAESDQRTNDAAQAYLDAARLGVNSRRGGPLIDNLVGIAEEAIGTTQLQKLVNNLDAKTSADLAHQLEALNSNEEPWEQILANEKYWTRNMYPGLQYRLAALLRWNSTKAEMAKAHQRFNTQQNKTRRLTLDLAVHAYQLDKGHRPTNTADLTPAYLKAAPIDPLTGKEMTLTP